jgi:acyl-CoA reductase-like NAD-dependent aldehyde dehydrogenase
VHSSEVDEVPESGSFHPATVITGARPDSHVVRNEIFGPVGALLPFRDEQEAIAVANDSRYGLAAAVWTQDLSTAMRVTSRIEAGMVWVNEYYAHVLQMPFGGYKESGLGKDYSLHALDSYSQLKEVAIRFDADR